MVCMETLHKWSFLTITEIIYRHFNLYEIVDIGYRDGLLLSNIPMTTFLCIFSSIFPDIPSWSRILYSEYTIFYKSWLKKYFKLSSNKILYFRIQLHLPLPNWTILLPVIVVLKISLSHDLMQLKIAWWQAAQWEDNSEWEGSQPITLNNPKWEGYR